MGYTDKEQRTFDLKLNLHCEKRVNDVKEIVLKIKGVDSIDIDIDKDLELKLKLKLGKATISENVDPQTVIKELKDRAKKHAELGGKEEKRPPKINHQEMQIVWQQNPVRNDRQKVAPQSPVIKELKDRAKKHAERGGKEEKRQPKINHQEMQIVRQQNPVRNDRRKVAPQPPGLISKSVDKPMEINIRDCDPKHDHELERKLYNKPFKCNRCREDGFKWGYRCKHCIYDLHKGCRNPKPEITHDLFPESIFEFCQIPGRKICDACGMEIHGHFYHCEEINKDLHPACSKLPGKLGISGTDFVLCEKVKYKCFWCKKEKPSWLAETGVAGLCYVSKRNKFSFHVHCLSLVMQDAWKRGRWDLDRNGDDDDNDGISKALEKLDLKLVATAKGSEGSGGLFLQAVTIFLKTIISILLGDPTGLIVFASTGLVKELLTL